MKDLTYYILEALKISGKSNVVNNIQKIKEDIEYVNNSKSFNYEVTFELLDTDDIKIQELYSRCYFEFWRDLALVSKEFVKHYYIFCVEDSYVSKSSYIKNKLKSYRIAIPKDKTLFYNEKDAKNFLKDNNDKFKLHGNVSKTKTKVKIMTIFDCIQYINDAKKELGFDGIGEPLFI